MSRVGSTPAANTSTMMKASMSVKEISKINKQISQMREKLNAYHQRFFPLESKRIDLIQEEILNNKMLANSSWEVEAYHNGSLCLNYQGEVDDAIMAPIISLSDGDLHYNFLLGDGIEFRLDNSYTTLTFDDPKKLPRFAAANELIINAATITARLHDLRREITAMEMLCHQLGLKG